MNTWKEQLIEYVSSLDDAISPENAEGLILSELARIKEVFSNLQEAEKTDIVDNTEQLHKAMGMSELITLYRDLFYGSCDSIDCRTAREHINYRR